MKWSAVEDEAACAAASSFGAHCVYTPPAPLFDCGADLADINAQGPRRLAHTALNLAAHAGWAKLGALADAAGRPATLVRDVCPKRCGTLSGATPCRSCPAGTYTPAEHATACTECDRTNTKADTDADPSTVCDTCTSGTGPAASADTVAWPNVTACVACLPTHKVCVRATTRAYHDEAQ
jgi:hypothetical protein